MKKITSTLLFSLLFVLKSTGVFAQNFSNGFNFNLPFDDGTPSVFLPNFPAKNLSETDRVSVNGGNFIVGGKPYRFWGVNLTAAGAFPKKENAPKMATRIRKMGINLVRWHHLDNNWGGADGRIFLSGKSTRELNPTALDRFEYFWTELKKQGVYSNINLNVSRDFNALDGVAGTDSLKDFAKGVTIFDPQLIDLQKEYARQLLTHKNPYTQTTLADDPSVAMVEIINENSLYGMWKDGQLKGISFGGNLLQRHVTLLDSLWNGFLVKKHSTQAALQTAWQTTNNVTPVERITNQGFEEANLGANWQMEQHQGAAATVSYDQNQSFRGSRSARVQIGSASGTEWHIQFKHINFNLKKGQSYTVRFAARANQTRAIGASVMRDDAPYTGFGWFASTATTQWQTFSFVVIPTEDVAKGRLSFNLGQSVGDVWFDDVSIIETQITGLKESESLASRTVQRMDYSSRGIFSKKRVADLAEFYILLQKDFMENMRLFLKNDLKVKAPITGTNALVGIQEAMQHENMDYLDDHSYWDHPNFPGTPWDMSNWNMPNLPLVKTEGGAMVTALNGIFLADKPYTISEYNHAFPNRFKAEMPHFMAAYGAFHGMDGLMFFQYQGENDEIMKQDFISDFFSLACDPVVMSLFPSCAWAYRNGLISEAKQPLEVSYSREDVFNSFENDSQGRWGKYVPYPLKTQLTHSVRVKTYNATQKFDPSVLPAPASRIFETDTKETTLNSEKGLLTTNTPRFVAISGFLNDNLNTLVGGLTLKSTTDFGSITWASFGQKNLVDADTSLLTFATRSQNTGMVWNAQNNSLGQQFGGAPTLVQPQSITLRLAINAKSVVVHTLSPTGQSVAKRTIAPLSTNLFEITFDLNSDKTLWYALEKQSTNRVGETPSIEKLKVSPNPAKKQITLDFQSVITGNIEISVSNLAGVTQLKQPLRVVLGEKYQIPLNITDLSAGVYFVRIGENVQKIVVE